MPHSAMSPKQICLQQPFALSETVSLSQVRGNEFHGLGPALANQQLPYVFSITGHFHILLVMTQVHFG